MDFRLQTKALILGFMLLMTGCASTTVGDNAVTETEGVAAINIVDDSTEIPTTEGVETEDVTDDSEPVTVFKLTGENFKFYMGTQENPDIVVQKGTRVRIELTANDMLHDWMVDEFNAATEKVTSADGMTYVEFVASEIGEFEYYCSVGSHRAAGMKGMLIVE